PWSSIVVRAYRLASDDVVWPPSTTSTVPVIHDAAGEHRNTAAAATSAGTPHRPSGIDAMVVRRNSGFCRAPSFMSVSIHPGASAFTRTCTPAHSRETVRVSEMIPAFALAQYVSPGLAMNPATDAMFKTHPSCLAIDTGPT